MAVLSRQQLLTERFLPAFGRDAFRGMDDEGQGIPMFLLLAALRVCGCLSGRLHFYTGLHHTRFTQSTAVFLRWIFIHRFTLVFCGCIG